MLSRILCVHIETSSLLAEFVRIDASVFVWYSRGLKAINFGNFDNSHKSILWPEYFIDYFCEIESMSGCDIRLVFTFPPKDSKLQYKKCAQIWNNFPCISTLVAPNFVRKFNAKFEENYCLKTSKIESWKLIKPKFSIFLEIVLPNLRSAFSW